MATHPSIFAWRISCTVEPSGLLSIASQRAGHKCSDLARMHALRLSAFQCQLVSNLTPSQSRVHSHSTVEAYARCEHLWVGIVRGTLEPCLPYQVWNPTACPCQFSSVQLSSVAQSLRPRGLQHTRLPCPSPTPGACSNSCPLSW